MTENLPTPVTAALLEELRRLARQLSPDDAPAVVFSA
jgi:hypothetical protein